MGPRSDRGVVLVSTTSRMPVKWFSSSKQYQAVPWWNWFSVSTQAQEYWRDRLSSDQARGMHRGKGSAREASLYCGRSAS